MGETRKLAAILVADAVGYSRLAGVDEERTLARLRGLRSDLIDPAIAAHHGRLVKRTGDGSIIEFRSVVDAVRCAIEVQNGLIERNAGVPEDRRIQLRVGIHVGDVVEEADGDLMGDGVNIAARIESIAEAGGVCLSQAAYDQVRDKIEHRFVELGERSFKNIARLVRVYALEMARKVVPRENRPRGASEGDGPPRWSIVVLPFANIGSDPEQDYFVDGVTDSLTTDLARMKGAFVTARNTAFTYRGRAVDAREVGRELNVRYVLEGSVQRRGERMRVNVQLVDAQSGNHLWAERFDKPVADFFEMQDEIVGRVASQLSVELILAEARGFEGTSSPDWFDLFVQGTACLLKGPTLESLMQAHEFFERALALDPAAVPALVNMALVEISVTVLFYPDDMATRLLRAEIAATKALSLAPDNAIAHYCMAGILCVANRAEQAIAECERALAIDPNWAGAHAVIGLSKVLSGRAEEAEAHIQEALRLSPRDPAAFYWLWHLGAAKILLARYEEAIAWLRRSIEANRNNPMSHFHLAAALALAGRLVEARAAAAAGLALIPQATIARLCRARLFSKDPAYLAGLKLIAEGLRKAGMPEE